MTLYKDQSFVPVSCKDWSDHSFLGVHLIERSISLLASQLTGDVLDVGCGTQPYRRYISKASKYTACDFDPTRGDVDFACPADKIPVPDGSYDSILCTEVLEHTPDPAAVWQEFARVLRPGGKVLLSTPMYWPSHEQPHDYFRYPPHGLVALAERAGFKVEALIPRGGVWAFIGQVVLHGMPQYFRLRAQRSIWNRAIIRLDRWRLNPNLTMGWTILAQKPLET